MSNSLIEGRPGSCQGSYDPNDKLCGICAIRSNCEKLTKQLAKPAQPEIKDTDSGDSMTPLEFFISSLKGRYDVSESEVKGIRLFKISKDGDDKGAMALARSGKIQIKFKSERVSLSMVLSDGFDSVRHANETFTSLIA